LRERVDALPRGSDRLGLGWTEDPEPIDSSTCTLLLPQELTATMTIVYFPAGSILPGVLSGVGDGSAEADQLPASPTSVRQAWIDGSSVSSIQGKPVESNKVPNSAPVLRK
jgi:hypothetical protein